MDIANFRMIYKKECVICGDKFETTNKYKDVCDKDHTPKPDKTVRECVVCGTEFELPKPTSKATTCSKECRNALIKSKNEKRG